MEFILSVFSANVLIMVVVFFYLYGAFTTMKNLKISESFRDEDGMWGEDKSVERLVMTIFWPVTLLSLIIYLICKIILPLINKGFDKITPTIKFKEEE